MGKYDRISKGYENKPRKSFSELITADHIKLFLLNDFKQGKHPLYSINYIAKGLNVRNKDINKYITILRNEHILNKTRFADIYYYNDSVCIIRMLKEYEFNDDKKYMYLQRYLRGKHIECYIKIINNKEIIKN